MHRISSLLFLLFVVLLLPQANAQVGQSPYTVMGLGTINSMATGRNIGMGGIGIGNSHYLYLNNMNPANLTRNSYYTTFEAGLSLESRSFATLEEEDNSSSGGLDYLALAFPLIYDKWTFNIGLAPYSTVSYNMTTSHPVIGGEGVSNLYFEGTGGTTQAYAATGFKIFKGLSAGVRASYIFGAITENIESSVQTGMGQAPSFTSRYHNRTSFSDVLFTGGLSYRQALTGAAEEDRFIMAGLTYDRETNLSAERFSRMERSLTGSGRAIYADTLADGEQGSYFLPAGFGAGLSMERLYHYAVGADVRLQNWSEYRDFEGMSGELGQSYRVALGGEWTPDYSSAQPGTYYKRMTYRMGLQYEKTPFIVNGESINDFGINFGLTLPVSNASSIHTSFMFGQRGKTGNDLIQERYFRLSLGVTFNDRWFTKVRYD